MQYDRKAVKKALHRAIQSPDHHWIPLNPSPRQLSDSHNVPTWADLFPRTSDEKELPARAELEKLLDAYFRMGHWDLAFLLCLYAYTGTLSVPSMEVLVWQGMPGASRLWFQRGTSLVPIPNGIIKTCLETWWSLSGGYMNPFRAFLPINEHLLQDHLQSLDSPLIHHRPFGSEDPLFVLDQIKRMHVNELGYPHSLNKTEAAFEDQTTVRKHGALWIGESPVWWGARIGSHVSRPTPRQDSDICATGPLGLTWLESARETIPSRIYEQARSLRENGYAPLSTF